MIDKLRDPEKKVKRLRPWPCPFSIGLRLVSQYEVTSVPRKSLGQDEITLAYVYVHRTITASSKKYRAPHLEQMCKTPVRPSSFPPSFLACNCNMGGISGSCPSAFVRHLVFAGYCVCLLVLAFAHSIQCHSF